MIEKFNHIFLVGLINISAYAKQESELEIIKSNLITIKQTFNSDGLKGVKTASQNAFIVDAGLNEKYNIKTNKTLIIAFTIHIYGMMKLEEIGSNDQSINVYFSMNKFKELFNLLTTIHGEQETQRIATLVNNYLWKNEKKPFSRTTGSTKLSDYIDLNNKELNRIIKNKINNKYGDSDFISLQKNPPDSYTIKSKSIIMKWGKYAILPGVYGEPIIELMLIEYQNALHDKK